MNPEKTLVVDLDNTVTVNGSHKWTEATVNQAVRAKINELWESGWDILIYTARGQVSCNGDLAEIERVYRKVIEEFLEAQDVKYTELRFGKPLGVFYVDDRAMTPEQFANTAFNDLTGGLSGAQLIRAGNLVMKTQERASEVAAWYRLMPEWSHWKHPKIHSVVNNTLTMDFVKGPTLLELAKTNYEAAESVCERLAGLSFNQYFCPPIKDIHEYLHRPFLYQNDFNFYVQRVLKHINANQVIQPLRDKILKRMVEDELRVRSLTGEPTFCHGDLSMENVIHKGDGREPWVIDPIPGFDNWNHWSLDVSKLMMSCRRHGFDGLRMKVANVVAIKAGATGAPNFMKFLETLELTHWIRLLSYARERDPALYGRAIDMIYKEFP